MDREALEWWAPQMDRELRRWWAVASARDPTGISALPDLGRGSAGREIAATIRSFTAFLRSRPLDSEAVFAWTEIWRLRAGLQPNPLFPGIIDCE